MTVQVISEQEFTLSDPELYLDPYAVLRAMRMTCPVMFDRPLDSWVITRYDDVSACLRDPRLYVVEETKRIDALPAARQAELEPLRRIFHSWGGRAPCYPAAQGFRALHPSTACRRAGARW